MDTLQTKEQHNGMPEDTHNLVYWILWVTGVGVLFPWNAFITAPDYFTKFHEFVDSSYELSDTESKMWDNILTYFTVAFSVLNLVGQALVVYFGGRITISERVLYSVNAMFIIMLLVPAISYISMKPVVAFSLLVTASGLCGFATAFYQSTSFGIGAMFPSEFTQSVMVGNSCSGIAVTVLRIITKATKGNLRLTGGIYFYLATAWLLFGIACFLVLRKLRFAQKHINEFIGYSRLPLDDESATSGKVSTSSSSSHLSHDVVSCKSALLNPEPGPVQMGSISSIFKTIAPMGFTVWLALFVSISVFPGVTAKIPSSLSDGWFTVWLVLTYNVGDSLGRIGPKFYKLPPKPLVVMGILRLGFIPLFIFCVDPLYINNEAAAVVICACMSMSNGYVAGMSMMYGPGHPDLRPEERETAGIIMSFMLLFGITCGSFTGLLICNYLPDTDSGSGST